MIDKQSICYISSIDKDGFPNTKAMLKPRKRNGIKEIYLSTNTSSRKVQSFRANHRACLYFCDKINSLGNVNDATIYEILKGQPFLNLINLILYRESYIENCKSCIWNKHCFKGCPALAYSKYGSFDHEIFCSFMKGLFERIIKEKGMSEI